VISLLQVFVSKLCLHFFVLSYTCYGPCSAYPGFDHCNNIWRRGYEGPEHAPTYPSCPHGILGRRRTDITFARSVYVLFCVRITNSCIWYSHILISQTIPDTSRSGVNLPCSAAQYSLPEIPDWQSREKIPGQVKAAVVSHSDTLQPRAKHFHE
jgi:hypothetical protein